MEHVTVFHIQRIDCLYRLVKTTGMRHHNDRRQQQRKNHQRGLYGIGPAYRQKSTDKHIQDRRYGTSPERHVIAQAKRLFEQTGTSHHTGSTVDREKHQNNHRRQHPQQFAAIFKTVSKIIRQS